MECVCSCGRCASWPPQRQGNVRPQEALGNPALGDPALLLLTLHAGLDAQLHSAAYRQQQGFARIAWSHLDQRLQLLC